MSEQHERFSALRQCKDAMDRLEFFRNDEPKCPHCGHDCEISENGWWRLYEEGEHAVTCPSCDQDFTVSASVSYSFSTDEQEQQDD